MLNDLPGADPGGFIGFGQTTNPPKPTHPETNVMKSRVPCTKVLSQEIQIFQETSFYVLQVLLLDFTNKIWQLYIDFYTVR